MLQLCTMATAHYDNALCVPMPIIHPKNRPLVVENSQLFAQRTVRPPSSFSHKRNSFNVTPRGWVLQVALSVKRQSGGEGANNCTPQVDGSCALPHNSLNPMGQLSQQTPRIQQAWMSRR